MSKSKKVRRPVNNSDHWTSRFFRFRGTLTAPEQTYNIIDWCCEHVFKTQEKFVAVVTDPELWTVVGVITYFACAIFVGNHCDRVKERRKNE